jgi:hypothetical protein
MPAFAFAVINNGGLDPDDVELFCTALDELINVNAAAFWPDFKGSRVRMVTDEFPQQSGEVPLTLDAMDGEPGDLAFHTTGDGMPVGRVQLSMCTKYGVPWQCAAAHEALEICANPMENLFVTAPNGNRYGREIVDFVTAAQPLVLGVPMCSFVTPLFFDPNATREQGQFDMLDVVTQPFPNIPVGGWAEWTTADGQLSSAYGDAVTPEMRAYIAEKPGRAKRIAAALMR